MSWLYVFLGGGLGSICRYLLALILPREDINTMPWATILTNIAACLILGIYMGYNYKKEIPESWLLFVAIGFCGGFSTFSTFTKESLEMIQSGHIDKVMLNILVSLLVCLICMWLTLKVVIRI